MNWRTLTLPAGVVALAASLAAALAPGAVVGIGRPVLTALGLLASVQVVRVARRRRGASLDEAATPDPELPATTPAPGDRVESVVDTFLDDRQAYFHRARLREGLRGAAVAVLTRYNGCTETRALDRVDAGTWTDDGFAAAFLGHGEAPSLGLRARLRTRLRKESTLRREVRHAVDAVADRAGLEPRDGLQTEARKRAGTDDGGDARSKEDRGTSTVTDPRRGSGGVSPPQFSTTGAYDDALDGREDAGLLARAVHATGHWRGVDAVVFLGVGLGVLSGRPAAFLAGAIGVGYVAYARSGAFSPSEVSLAVDRTVETGRPDPGEAVTVTLSLTNEGDRPLVDLRVVDGVPEGLAVTDGSPRLGTALGPGETVDLTYDLTARRGVHEFGPCVVLARDLAGATEEKRLYPGGGSRDNDAEDGPDDGGDGDETRTMTTLTCVPPLRVLSEPVPLRDRATRYVGRVETDTGGEGLEFHATREYRRGDSLRRIDWNRKARTGDLTTVEFREERTATVLLLVDTRTTAYVSPEPTAPHAVDRSVAAVRGLFASLTAAGDQVGVAALGSDRCVLAPGAGADHRVRARELLGTHPAFSPVPPDAETGTGTTRTADLRRRLPADTQVFFLTPLCEDDAPRVAHRLDEHGFPVTVLSPDPTADRTAGHRLARVARRLRVSRLRARGVPVVDWAADEPVAAALARHVEAES